MMSFFIFWFMCGFLALAIDIWSDYNKGKDIKVNDTPYMFVGVCLGIFTLLMVVCVHLKRTDAILIKGKTKYTPSEDFEEESEPKKDNSLKSNSLED